MCLSDKDKENVKQGWLDGLQDRKDNIPYRNPQSPACYIYDTRDSYYWVGYWDAYHEEERWLDYLFDN